MEGAAAKAGDPLWEGGCEPAVLSWQTVPTCRGSILGTTVTTIELRGTRGMSSTLTPIVPSLPQHSLLSRCPQNDWNILIAIPTIAIIVADAPPAARADSKSISYTRMTDYVITVRTYKRPELFQRATLRVLRDQGLLDRLYVFVGSDIAEYAALEPSLRYIQAPVGGHNAIRAICDYFPRGQPILFLDDDLEEFFQYDVLSDSFQHHGLHELVVSGFAHAPFTFKSMTNRFWMKSLPSGRPSYSTMAGCYFGSYNEPELITTDTAHCDDLLRTVAYLKRGRVPWAWQYAGFKTKYAKNPGGLQESGDRTDTLAVCHSIGPQLEGWVSGIVQQACGFYAWKLLSAATLKKKIAKLTHDTSGI